MLFKNENNIILIYLVSESVDNFRLPLKYNVCQKKGF